MTGAQVVEGTLTTRRIAAGRLTVKNGAKLTHPASTATTAESLEIELAGDLVVEAGGAIDVTGLGYLAHQLSGRRRSRAAPAAAAISASAAMAAARTFGSVYRPRENGGGAEYVAAGGGSVRIVARHVTIDGAISANGGMHYRGGAGGSVWITASGNFGGAGGIDAQGGVSNNSEGGGGGGAIAVEYATSSGALPGKLTAWRRLQQQRRAARRRRHRPAARGRPSLRQPLIVNGRRHRRRHHRAAVPRQRQRGQRRDRRGARPRLRARRPISSATRSRSATPPAISKAAGGSPRWPARCATLEPNGGETLAFAPGDKWQGVYRFDNLTTVQRGDPAKRRSGAGRRRRRWSRTGYLVPPAGSSPAACG